MGSNSILTKPSDDYIRQREKRREVKACLGGKAEVLRIKTCLPNPQYETYSTHELKGYAQRQAQACNEINLRRADAYWARGRFFAATARTFESLGGMVWSKEPQAELDPSIEYLLQNADGCGTPLREVAQEITDDVIAYGSYGVLVDMPSNESALTLAEMQQSANAPRLVQYDADQIIYYRMDGNKLAEVRLLETKQVQQSEYEWDDVTCVRRLVLIDGIYVNQLFDEKDNLISETVPIVNGAPSNEIKFLFFGADANTSKATKIPLYDLANLNLGHFVLDCDNRDNLHYHGQGMTNIYTDMDGGEFSDSNPNGVSVSGSGRNLFRQGDRVEILQIAATGALPAEMERDQQRMIMAGAQLITETSTNQTLGAKEIETNASTSTLKRIVYNVSAGMEKCLLWCSEFLGSTQESAYKINTDFIADTMTPEMITKHIEMVQLGVLPKATLYETSRKVGFTKLEDDELADLAEQDAAEMAGVSEQQAQQQAQQDSQTEEDAE